MAKLLSIFYSCKFFREKMSYYYTKMNLVYLYGKEMLVINLWKDEIMAIFGIILCTDNDTP